MADRIDGPLALAGPGSAPAARVLHRLALARPDEAASGWDGGQVAQDTACSYDREYGLNTDWHSEDHDSVSLSEAAVQRVICEYLSTRFGIAHEKLTSAARFQEDLGLDSIEVTEALLSVEDETGIDLELARLATIDDVTSIGALAAAVSRAAAAPAETRKP